MRGYRTPACPLSRALSWPASDNLPKVGHCLVAATFRDRTFAIVHLAGDGRPLFPVERTSDILRTLAPIMAPSSNLSPNDFRQRFFHDAFDPVDAWQLQLLMHDVAHADDHAGLKDAGQALAKTIDHYGAKDWSSMLRTTWVAPTTLVPSMSREFQVRYEEGAGK